MHPMSHTDSPPSWPLPNNDLCVQSKKNSNLGQNWQSGEYGWTAESIRYLSSPVQPDSKASSIQRDSDYLLWHGHMGHSSHNTLCHTFNHVFGILKLDISLNLCPCCGCSLGKATESPFPSSTSRGDKPLGLVHTDLCEFPVQSHTKHIWMMTFLDDFSGYSSIVCLKLKSDTATAFCNWFVWAEKACGYKLLKLYLDHGGKYTPLISSDLWNFLSKNSIEHQMTVPHRP